MFNFYTRWCLRTQSNIFCDGICSGCLYAPQPFTVPQTYNYKCSCGGEFMLPYCIYEYSPYKEIYKCPFCGKLMEGMNNG